VFKHILRLLLLAFSYEVKKYRIVEDEDELGYWLEEDDEQV
jgi:hypothetical protein